MNKLSIIFTVIIVAGILFVSFTILKNSKTESQQQTDQTVDATAKSLVNPIMNNQTPPVETDVQN